MPDSNQIAQAAAPVLVTRPAPPAGYEDFFRTSFRELVRGAMDAGATLQEAEDAASQTMSELLPKWPLHEPPLTYARKATFLKGKERGPRRVARRMVERGHVPHHEGAEDRRLTELEDDEWIGQVLSVLTPAQREVMECIARGLGRDEIPEALGKSPEAIRRHLCDARKHLRRVLNPGPEPAQPPRSTARSPREETR